MITTRRAARVAAAFSLLLLIPVALGVCPCLEKFPQ